MWTAATGGLVWFFYGFDWNQFLEHLRGLDWKWVAPAVFFDVFSYVCQAARWNYVLKPLGPPTLYRSTQAIYIGLLTNEVVPLRGGEIIRTWLVSRWAGLRFSVVLCSVGVERLLDGIWLAVFLGLSAFAVDLPPLIKHSAWVLAVVVLAGAALIVVVLATGLRVTHALERTRAGQRGPLAWLLHFLDHLFEGLQAIGHSASLYWALAASLALLVAQILAVWAMMFSYNLEFTFWQASVVLLILHLGTVLPNAPANIGSFQVFCVLALRLFGVEENVAKGFTLVLFMIITGPLVIFGLLALFQSGLTVRDLRHQVRQRFNSGRADDPA